MLLRRALPAARQSLAHSFPICEMGSKLLKVERWMTVIVLPKVVAPSRACLNMRR
jgi:hypothetical protein